MAKLENLEKARVWSKIEKFPRLLEWGDKEGETKEIIGTPLKISTGKTQYGEAEFLHIEEEYSGEVVSVALGSALSGYGWAEYFGELIRLVYEGEEKSKNHKGKTFKVFSLYVAQ